MSIKSNRNADALVQLGTLPSAAEVCSGTGVASAGANFDGTRGAPPSNTAPNNSNPYFVQPLRWGVDSLYLSYPGQVSDSIDAELRDLKKLAQDRDDLAAIVGRSRAR